MNAWIRVQAGRPEKQEQMKARCKRRIQIKGPLKVSQ
jgi:hypothetical protein